MILLNKVFVLTPCDISSLQFPLPLPPPTVQSCILPDNPRISLGHFSPSLPSSCRMSEVSCRKKCYGNKVSSSVWEGGGGGFTSKLPSFTCKMHYKPSERIVKTPYSGRMRPHFFCTLNPIAAKCARGSGRGP